MVANNHYDDDGLLKLLRQRMGDGEDLALSHVESCTTCQDKLETISRSGMTWDEVSELLRPDEASLLMEWRDSSVDEPHRLRSAAKSFLEPTDHPDSLGRFARYEIMELLGHGGMGIVMRGFDTSLSRHSAIKVLAPELASSAAARKRFSREAKSAAAVVHPHVVPIQTVDEHNGLPYLVMPVVEGQSLQQRVEQTGPLSVIESVRIAAQVAEGLQAAHEQGLVHRDIKPANVLLENGVERVQITDFGLARAIDDASMTRSGVIAGTPQYMSPEQAHGDTIDHRSDLFSLGSLIYFMLTGRSPFRAETTMGVLNRIANDEPRSIRSINADVPQWLEKIVMKLLKKTPDDRFQSATDLAELLKDWHASLQQPGIVKPPQNLTVPLARESDTVAASEGSHVNRLHRWLIATAAFAFFAIAGVLIVLKVNQGTLTVESEVDNVPIRILKGDEVIEKLTVTKSGVKIKVPAGMYVVEIETPNETEVILDKGVVKLKRGETEIVRITESGDTRIQRRQIANGSDDVRSSLVTFTFHGTCGNATLNSFGIGWIVDNNGRIAVPALNLPACEDEQIEIRTASGKTATAKRVATAGLFTLLTSEAVVGLPPIALSGETQLSDGDLVFGILNSRDPTQGKSVKAKTTIVLTENVSPPLRFYDVIQTDLKPTPETHVGAPLLDTNGAVTGMIVNVRGHDLIALPIQELISTLDEGDALSANAGFPRAEVLQEMHDLLAEKARLSVKLRYQEQFLEGGSKFTDAESFQYLDALRDKTGIHTREKEITDRLETIHEKELGDLQIIADDAVLECSEEPLYGQPSYGVIVYARTLVPIRKDELLLFHAGSLYRSRGTLRPLNTTGTGFYLRPQSGIPTGSEIALACIQDSEEEQENVVNGNMPDSNRARDPSRAYRANVFDRKDGHSRRTSNN